MLVAEILRGGSAGKSSTEKSTYEPDITSKLGMFLWPTYAWDRETVKLDRKASQKEQLESGNVRAWGVGAYSWAYEVDIPAQTSLWISNTYESI